MIRWGLRRIIATALTAVFIASMNTPVDLAIAKAKPRVAASKPIIQVSGNPAKFLKVKAGKWSTGAKFTYQWLSDGYPIDGEKANIYTLMEKDCFTEISVRVTGSKPGFKSVTKVSDSYLISTGCSVAPAPEPPKLCDVGTYEVSSDSCLIVTEGLQSYDYLSTCAHTFICQGESNTLTADFDGTPIRGIMAFVGGRDSAKITFDLPIPSIPQGSFIKTRYKVSGVISPLVNAVLTRVADPKNPDLTYLSLPWWPILNSSSIKSVWTSPDFTYLENPNHLYACFGFFDPFGVGETIHIGKFTLYTWFKRQN